MYNRITAKTGVTAVQQFRDSFPVASSVDGLQFANNDGAGFIGDIDIPDRLFRYLVDLRLLRNIPIAYLVPDAALLPPESIRFFHVDTTWLDRVIDGVFSASNTGTVDSIYSSSFLRMARQAIDQELGLSNGTRVTGMLIRSELVRRWPKMIVRAYSTVVSAANVPSPPPDSSVPVLRAEPISKDLYLALFAGAPLSIHVREPFVGVRFGVEEQPDKSWHVDKRNADGSNPGGFYVVKPRTAGSRTLDISNLVSQLAGPNQKPRMVALELEQRPYVQIFRNTVAESTGSVPYFQLFTPSGTWNGPVLRGGRSINVSAIASRLAQTQFVSTKEKP
jgi:hypothetical protein